MKVYQNQVRKLERAPSDKTAVIASERKLQTLGFVDFVDNLCAEDIGIGLSIILLCTLFLGGLLGMKIP